MTAPQGGLQFDPEFFHLFVGTAEALSLVRTKHSEEPRHPDPKVTVLVIDNHRLFADGLVSLLGTEPGIELVGHSGTMLEAFELVATERPDVALLDWDLPRGTGAETTRIIRERSPDTKVVLLTSEADGSILTDAMAAGCSGLVDKHGGLREVVDAVRAAHRGDVTVPVWPTSSANGTGGPEAPPTNLTKRELEVLGLLAQGLSSAALSEQLSITLNTVRNHVQRILDKLGVHSKLEAVTASLRSGVVTSPRVQHRR
jgi:DNA-binding NarL/FixJ family response regulator